MLAITTSQLTLRLFEFNDLDRLVALASEPLLTQQTEHIHYPKQRIMSYEKWLKTQLRAYKEQQMISLAIIRQRDQTLIGGISLMDISQYHRRAEIGYWIGLPFWGQGYAAEAINAITNFAFTQLAIQRIEARCFSTNQQSINVLKKCGFLFEGELKQARYFREQFINISLFAKLYNKLPPNN